MKVAIQKSTGRVIEMQSHAPADVLTRNAVAAGFAEADVEVRDTDLAGYNALRAAQPKTPAESNDEVKARITVLERSAQDGYGEIPRRLREILVAKVLPAGDADRAKLEELESALGVERAKLIKER